MASRAEQDPQITQEREMGSEEEGRARSLGRTVLSSVNANVKTLKDEAVWELAVTRGIFRSWLTRLVHPTEVMEAERKAVQQAAT